MATVGRDGRPRVAESRLTLVVALVALLLGGISVALSIGERGETVPEGSAAGRGVTSRTRGDRRATGGARAAGRKRSRPALAEIDLGTSSDAAGVFDSDKAHDAPVPLSPEERLEIERQELHEKIVDPFNLERRSEVWAHDAELVIGANFDRYVASHPATGVSIDDLECRASRCRVKLVSVSARQRDRMQDDLFELKAISLEGCMLHSVGYQDDPGREQFFQELYVDCPRIR